MTTRTACLLVASVFWVSGCAKIQTRVGTTKTSDPVEVFPGRVQHPPSGSAPLVETVAFHATAPPEESDETDKQSAPSDEPSVSPAISDLTKTEDTDENPLLIASPQDLGEGRGFTLEEIEKLALQSNPAIAAAEANESKASGLRYQVGLKPNPTLGYSGQQIADRNTDQHSVFIEQEFVRGDKLELNRAVLQQTTQAQQWETQTQRYRVLTDVRIRFYEALAAQQRFDAINNFAEVAERGVQVAEERFEAEEGTLIETLQAQTLFSETKLASRQALVTYRGTWQSLAAIAGLESTAPVRLAANLDAPIITPDWSVAHQEIVADSPELSAARAIVCEKRALLCRQQVQATPNVTAQFGAGYDDSTNHGMINLQFGVPIPINNRNTGNISAAYADYVNATQNVARIEQSIRERLARSAQAYDSALAAVETYQDEIIPQAQRSLKLSEEAYRAGELDFLTVLIARRTFFESTVRQIVAKGRLAQSAAMIDGLLLTGGLQMPVDYTDGDGIRSSSFGGQ